MKFPPEFTTLFRLPGTRAAFVSEIRTAHPGACSNCGGMGKIFAFIATAGPLNSPPAGIACHFDDGKWWGGSTHGAICPACRGTGQDPAYTEKPYTVPEEWVGVRIKRLAEARR